MSDVLRIGIDIGSTTIKMVILDEQSQIIFQQYVRHFSDITAAFHNITAKAHHVLRQKLLSVMVTGSAGIGLSQSLGLPFVQEVIASTTAIRQILPNTDTAIELGGEDAKITYLDHTVEQRMNGVCAGGTGSFIDHMASLLNTDPAGLNELAKKHKTIHPIASRCGVFARTDVQALMNEGVSKADIAASVLQAVVNQTISSLAQGRAISGRVALLGGPLHFLSELRRRFTETLGLTPEQTISPECSPYIVAIGAAMTVQGTPVSCEHFYQQASPHLCASGLENEQTLPPLFLSNADYQQFKLRHAQHAVARSSLKTHAGNAYLGIDAGSTTLKLALIDDDKNLLYSYYGSNLGASLDTAIAAFKDLYLQLSPQTQIMHSAVTGYGEHLIKSALQIDIGEVETVAHLTSARHFSSEVSFVLDIGGQDMKSFCVCNGVIDSIVLNEACSSGCGSFIENFAQALGMTIQEFSQLGLKSRRPVDLGTRCTVFMNSKVKQVQKEGAEVSDIAAGISISIVKNALFKVIRLKNTAELGENIVVQGGTFCNDAVLRAVEQLLGREVIRPDIAGLMGAFGAALIARERCLPGSETTLLSADALDRFVTRTSNHRCNRCGNQCLITSQHFPNGQTYHAGNRCERGVGKSASGENLPNLYAYKYQRVFQYDPLPESSARRGVIGIPRVLNLYEDYPFWFTLFTRLGYRVILSGRSSRPLYESGMDTIPSDSLCYPAKLVHGHISDLLQKGIRKIFYPCIPYNTQEDPGSDNCYNCPIVTSYPETIKSNMDSLLQQDIAFYHPFLPLNHRERLIKRLSQELAGETIAKNELVAAVDAAYTELDRYKMDVRNKGQETLEFMTQRNLRGVVLAGRPYHIDPEIHHGLPELIQSYGLVILSEDAVRHLGLIKRPLRIVDQWVYHSRLYAAASFTAGHPSLEFIQINSFGCGLDAITIDQVKEILTARRRIHTTIKLDEISNLGAARIRIRSLLAALNDRERMACLPQTATTPIPERSHEPVHKMKHSYTLLAPQLSPIHFQFLEAGFQKAGYQLIIAPMPDKQAIDEGLKYVNNDACYPAILVVGQLLQALQSGRYDLHRTALLLAQTGGCCRATNYAAITRKALNDAGLPQVPVLAFGRDARSELPMTLPLLENLIIGTLYGDLLMRVLYRVRPYEKKTGSAQALYEYWAAKCRHDLLMGGRRNFKSNMAGIVQAFDSLEIETGRKPRVGLVGEILVKYHPTANNRLVELLESEGAEVVVPDLLDFYLYCAYDSRVDHDFLAGSLLGKLKGSLFIKAVEFYRRHLRQVLTGSQRFSPPSTIEHIAGLASQHVSLGNLAGEGWLLTGEMLELLQAGVHNIVCMQPFACLPNHITGKGMLRELRRCYSHANIVPVDYDPGASEVNQLNRIKLMLAVAKQLVAGTDNRPVQTPVCKI
ncbi:MAG: acyl-CoA dehydratase activase-related protein [Negativicutes bacterium]